MSLCPRDALVERLGRYDSLLEVGIGGRTGVAAALADAGHDVTATDRRTVPVPDGVRFVRDDIVDRAERDDPGSVYRVDAVYGLNLPPELHRPAAVVADAAGAAFLFSTLGGDPPTVPTHPETLPGTTLHVAHDGESRGGGGRRGDDTLRSAIR